MSESSFKPAWWLPGPHLQTLWPTLCRKNIKNLPLTRERFELPDGDFLDLDWYGKSGPIVIILHGLEGSIDSPYAKGMLQALVEKGWRGVFMHFRGCSGEPNRLPRSYHSGETSDLACVVQTITQREPNTHLAAIGFSLGGNVLLKWLGETAENNPLTAAIAISVPFELHKSAERIQRGFSRIYQWHFLKCLQKRLEKKFHGKEPPIDLNILPALKTLQEFDDKVTAPLHGFKCAAEYYQKSSSRQYLGKIKVPTLLLHAKDDPFMSDDILPSPHELSDKITLEISPSGGHVGFVTGPVPWRASYWLEQRIPEFLLPYLSTVETVVEGDGEEGSEELAALSI